MMKMDCPFTNHGMTKRNISMKGINEERCFLWANVSLIGMSFT